MLHKNRSKNRNHWKFTLILPLLALFIMSFNTKEIIVEDESSNSIIINDELMAKEIVEIIITKDFSESDFKKIKEKFTEAGVTLKFKGIKRNENDEITAIKIEASTKGSNANFNTNSDEPIKPIKITIDNENNSISIGNVSMIHGDGFVFETNDGKHKIHKSGKGNNSFFFKSDEHDEDEDIIIIKKNGKVHEVKNIHKGKNVFIIHGEGDEDSFFEIKSDDNSIFKIKGDNENKIIIKNGKVIKEWKDTDDVWVKEDRKITIIGKGKGNKVFFSNSGDKEPLFVLNGKKVSKKVIDGLDSDKIDKIEVLKGKSATKEYGKKGKDGVVIITTKKE